MGTNNSKSNAITATETNVPDNPDPRSPSPEIVRTPLQDKTGNKHNITKIMDLSKTLDDDQIDEKLGEEIRNNNPILAAVIKNHLQSYDPRSPTQDFERTPIIIPSKLVENKRVLEEHFLENVGTPVQNNSQNFKNANGLNGDSENVVPKNLCSGFFEMALDDLPSIKGSHESVNSLTVSEEKKKNETFDECTTKNPEFLETNFEYYEDADNAEELDDSHQVEKEGNSALNCQIEVLKNDPRSPSEGIERTPIVITKVEASVCNKNVEEMSDETLIEVLQNTNIAFRQTLTRSQRPNKESLLIYEDESDNKNSETPRKPNSARNSGSRTPLSCMKNKTGSSKMRSKSENTINNSADKVPPSRIAKRVSHIPRLTSLSKLQCRESSVSLKGTSKIMSVSGDCENTPPHSHRDHWDKDKSIVL